MTFTIYPDGSVVARRTDGWVQHLGKLDVVALAREGGVAPGDVEPVSECEYWAVRNAPPGVVVASPNGVFVTQDVPRVPKRGKRDPIPTPEQVIADAAPMPPILN